MKLFKVNEAKEMSGSTLTGMEGTLSAIYAPQTGESNGKPWKKQSGMIKDETGEMKVTFWDHDEISMLMKGHRIMLQSTDGAHGKNGVKVKPNTYKGVTTAEISVSATGKAWFPDVQDAPSEEGPKGNDGPDAPPAPKTESYERKWIPSQPKANVDTTKTAQDRVAQFRMMYEICYKEAVTFTTKADIEALEDTRQIATAFFIQAVREGLERGLHVKTDKPKEDDIIL